MTGSVDDPTQPRRDDPTHPRLVGAGDPALAPSSDISVALAQLAAVPAGDETMERDRLVVGGLVGSRTDGALRTAKPGHLTGSAFVVDAPGERCLLLLHTKLRRWLQPGGHADGNTNLASVAWNEATEESGIEGLRVWSTPIDVDVHLVAPPDDEPHLHLDVRFLVVAPTGAEPVGNEESQALRWVEAGELGAYDVDAGLRRLAERAFALAASLGRNGRPG